MAGVSLHRLPPRVDCYLYLYDTLQMEVQQQCVFFLNFCLSCDHVVIYGIINLW